MGKIGKIKSVNGKILFGCFSFSVNEFLFGQDSEVLSEFIIDVPHQVRGIFVVLIIISISASVIAKFFVRPTNDFFSTF